MNNVNAFLLITPDDDKLCDFTEKCKSLGMKKTKYLDKRGNDFAVCGVLDHSIVDTISDAARYTHLDNESDYLLFILDNQSYVCRFTDGEVHTAITVYNHAKSVVFTVEGEKLPLPVQDSIKEWLSVV